jgi:hypothetical protein
MRTTTAILALLLVLLAPSASFARCRMSPGDQLVVLTPRASGRVVLLQRRPAYSEGAVLTADTPATLRLRRSGCTSGCNSQVALRAIAPNLYALELPAAGAAGTYEITTPTARGRFERPASAASTLAPTGAAPTTPTIDRQMVGTGYFAPTVVLGAAAPATSIGVLARWQGSSFFMPVGTDSTRFLLFAGRCRGALPGYTPPTPGTEIEVAFVDAEGRLSPTSRVTLRDVSLGAR